MRRMASHAIALIGTYAMQGRVRFRPKYLVRFSVISVVLLAAALLGIRTFYTYVYIEPYTKDRVLASLELLGDPQGISLVALPMDAAHELVGLGEIGGAEKEIDERTDLQLGASTRCFSHVWLVAQVGGVAADSSSPSAASLARVRCACST